jgi:AcrR family transcriptional regulator
MTATATIERAPRGARRDDILQAALRCFAERGYERTTMEEIRARSGASIGSIYHHFGGKEQLAAALHVEGLADYQESFARALFEESRAEDAVKAVVRNHLHWVAANRRLAAFMLSGREPEVVRASQDSIVGMNQRLIDLTREWIEGHVQAGALRPMPTRLFYAVLIGPSQEFARQWLKRRDRTALEAALEALPEAAWRAVRA